MSSAYKDWCSKGTINDLITNVSLLEKSTEANSSQYDKDEEVGSSRKIEGKKGKAPMDDLDGKAPEFSDIIQESPGILLMNKKRGLKGKSDSEYDPETNFTHGGRNKRETMTPTIVRGSLGDDFLMT